MEDSQTNVDESQYKLSEISDLWKPNQSSISDLIDEKWEALMNRFEINHGSGKGRIQSSKPITEAGQENPQSKRQLQENESRVKKIEGRASGGQEAPVSSQSQRVTPQRPASGKRKEFDIDEELRKLNSAFGIKFPDEKEEEQKA